MIRVLVHFLSAFFCAAPFQLSAEAKWAGPCSSSGPSDAIDLELSALAANPDPAPYIFTGARFTLHNKGAAPAQNIEVKINLPAAGLLLKGGDEYNTSQGSFAAYGNQVWTVGELAPGASAVLNLNFFNLNSDPKIVFSQVQKAAGTDGDSTPGNGICCAPAEDDEAAISFNGAPIGSADLSLQLRWNGPPKNNGVANFTLLVSNAGPATATGVAVKVDGVTTDHEIAVLAASQGVYNTGSREWLVGTLPAGATATLNYNEFLVDFEGYGPAYAFAQVQTSHQNDPNSTPGNKTATKTPTEDDEAAVLVYPVGDAVFHDLSLAMSANRSTALPGDEVEIRLRVNNTAAFTVGGVTAQVLLPPEFQLLSALPAAGSFNAATGIWDIGYVEHYNFPGAEKTLTLRVKINSIGAPKTIYAQILTSKGFNEPDSQPGNGTCCTPLEDDEAAVTIAPRTSGGCTNNLLINPGFENDTTRWYNIGGTEITTDAKTGSKAVKICGPASGGLVQTIAGQPGKSYTLLGWGKRDNSPNASAVMTFWIKFLSDSWQSVGIQSVQVTAKTYTAYSLEAIAPAGTAWVEAGIYKHNGAGCFFADDLCLTETGTGGGQSDLAFDFSNPIFTPEGIAAGEPFRATLPFINMGAASTGHFQVTFYISQKRTPDSTAVQLGTTRIFPIQAGTSLNISFVSSIPADFQAGTAYFIAKLDNLDENAENDEGNNLYTVPVNVLGFGQPNVKNGYSGDEGEVLAGGIFSLNSYKVFCNGARAMPAQVHRVYLSTDKALSADDLVLRSYTADVLPVCGNIDFACSSFSLGDVRIPPNTAAGLYFVLVKLDADDVVAEVSEADNVGFATLTVTGSSSAYCGASGNFPWEDWISGVNVNGVSRTSGKSPYSNFTPAVFPVSIGADNTLELTTTWSYFTFDENWGVWIDFNHDQIFQPGEKVFEGQTIRPPTGAGSKTLAGHFTLPAGAMTGHARMRVVMRRGVSPEACGIFPFGEAEDYTVDIAGAAPSGFFREKTDPDPATISDFTLFPNPARDGIALDLSAWRARPAQLELYNNLGVAVKTWRIDPVSGGLISLEFGEIQNGQYLLRCLSPGVRPVIKKVVVCRGD